MWDILNFWRTPEKNQGKTILSELRQWIWEAACKVSSLHLQAKAVNRKKEGATLPRSAITAPVSCTPPSCYIVNTHQTIRVIKQLRAQQKLYQKEGDLLRPKRREQLKALGRWLEWYLLILNNIVRRWMGSRDSPNSYFNTARRDMLCQFSIFDVFTPYLWTSLYLNFVWYLNRAHTDSSCETEVATLH